MFWMLVALIPFLSSCDPTPSNHFSIAHESEPLLRVPSGEPESLDPRQVRSLNGVTALHMLYDGLLRHDYRGNISPAIAKSYEVSNNLKRYTFYLRDSSWSNGDPVTADDFRESWLSQLDPDFPAPNAYQLFTIKGAQAYKEGRGRAEDVGIVAPNAHTLVVELENPTPYFPEIVASHFLYPVHSSTRSSTNGLRLPIGNGPYQVSDWRHNSGLIAERNDEYWDRSEVKLDQVELVFVDDTTALNMFLAGELHWAGSPNSNLPNDSIPTLSEEQLLHATPAAGTNFLRFNTANGLLTNMKFRRALSLALDRKAIAKHLMQGKQEPAFGLVPSRWRDIPISEPRDSSWELFQASLNEMDLSIDELPQLTLCYANNSERNQKMAQAIQQQWQKKLGISVALEQCESVVYFDRLHQNNYDISLGSWFADFKDPINFLEVFKTADNSTNNTGWEHPLYTEMLNQSATVTDPQKRRALLEEAEDLLISEAPIAPLFHVNFLYGKQEGVYGVTVSELGHLDFKYAYIDDPDIDELMP